MVETRITNAGPVGPLPEGAYDAAKSYRYLMTVLHNHDSWICIYTQNGSPFDDQGNWLFITGQEPADDSPYWKALTDGGRAAVGIATGAARQAEEAVSEQVELARAAAQTAREAAANANAKAAQADTAAGNADEKAALADGKAALAQQQGDYAKQQGDYAKLRGDYPPRVNPATSYWQYYNPATGKYEDTDIYAKGDNIDYSTMTEQEKEDLSARVVQQVTADNVLGPAYDSKRECVVFPTTMAVRYDDSRECVVFG